MGFQRSVFHEHADDSSSTYTYRASNDYHVYFCSGCPGEGNDSGSGEGVKMQGDPVTKETSRCCVSQHLFPVILRYDSDIGTGRRNIDAA